MSRLASGRCIQGTAKLEASLPAGFQNQLNEVVRAVLLGQPTGKIHCFIADFLDTQLDQRTQRELSQQPAPGKVSTPLASIYCTTKQHAVRQPICRKTSLKHVVSKWSSNYLLINGQTPLK